MHRRQSRRTSRDAATSVRGSALSSGTRTVSIARYRREVVALLVASRKLSKRLDSTLALRLVVKWDKLVRLRHSKGKPPCDVADHILKYETQGIVCPCGTAYPASRDPQRGSRRKGQGACSRCGRSRRAAVRASRDPACVLLDGDARMHGHGSKRDMMARGKGKERYVMCSARGKDLVDVHNVARDVQIIIRDDGKSSKRSKPKKTYRPRKTVKRRYSKPLKRKPASPFLDRMRAKYGDGASSLNTETERDPESKAYRQGVLDGKEDARKGEASDIVSAWHSHKLIHGSLRQYAKGYIKGSKMPPRQREHEWRRVLTTIARGPRRSQWGVAKNPGRDPGRKWG